MTRIRKPKSKRKSMHCGRTSLARAAALVLLLSLLVLNGCAKSPWTSVLEGEQRTGLVAAFADFIDSQNQCTPSWDAQVTIAWTSAVRNYSFDAYCRMLEPSYLRVIVSNPLGQPLKIIGINSTTYQAIDTVQRSTVTGSLRSWAVRHDLPLNLVHGSWLDWLGGRSSAAAEQIGEIRLDSEHRGAWFNIHVADTETLEEYILFNRENGKIVERILIDEHGQVFATLEYLEWQEVDGCLYPVTLVIGELPLGGRAELRFSDIRQSSFEPADFNIYSPRGFSRTWLP
jgi:hypothetical protein